tara:strand:- start:174 stop:341 length:168 start_codon:yes stop_codon:yes gene_type:complete
MAIKRNLRAKLQVDFYGLRIFLEPDPICMTDLHDRMVEQTEEEVAEIGDGVSRAS